MPGGRGGIHDHHDDSPAFTATKTNAMMRRALLLVLVLALRAAAQTLPSPRQGGTGASNTPTNQCHLRADGTNFITSCVLQDNGTDATDTGKLTVQGSTSKFGTAGTAHTMEVGQGAAAGTETATLRVKAGGATTAAVPKIDLRRGTTDISEWRTDGTSTYFDYVGTLFYEAGIGGGNIPLTFDVNGNLGINNTNVPYTAASGLVGIVTPALNVGGTGTAGNFQVDASGNVTSAAYVASANTNTAPAMSYIIPTGYVLYPPFGTQRLVGAITARSVGTARTRLRDENKNVTLPLITATRADYSFTVATLNQRRFYTTFYFQGRTRGTVQGSGGLRGMDDGQVLLSTTMPGSLQIASGEYREFARRQYLQGNARIRLQGGAFLLGVKS